MSPRLLDLFCGAGGAAMGYHRAGFEVVGVDIKPQPHYPFAFVQADAMTFPLNGFDAIHASPPCQEYSALKGFVKNRRPMLVDAVRLRLCNFIGATVIENVVGAPLRNPVTLCGSMFGLGVRRHRLFEFGGWCRSRPLVVPQCEHDLQPEPIDVTGSGAAPLGKRKKPTGGLSRKPTNLAHAREVMGIDWMTRRELSQAIPPAYTEWLGRQLLESLEWSGAA